MSGLVTGLVLKYSPVEGAARMVMIVLSDHAGSDGTRSYPSVLTISQEGKLSRSTVQRALRALEDEGHIVREGTEKKGNVSWAVDLTRLVEGAAQSGGQHGEAGVIDDVEGAAQSGPNHTTKPSITPVVPVDDPVERVFDYWRKVMKHPRAQLDTPRRRTIEKALKVSTPHECAQAIRGCSRSEFHMATGQYRGGTVHDKLSLILRNREQMESFMAMAPQTANHSGSDPLDSSAVDATIRENKLNVLRGHDLAGNTEARTKGDESVRWLSEHGIRVVRDPGERPRFEAADDS